MKLEKKICVIHNWLLDEAIFELIQWSDLFVELEAPATYVTLPSSFKSEGLSY